MALAGQRNGGPAAKAPAARPPVILAAMPACAQLREIAAHSAPDYVFVLPRSGASARLPRWREQVGSAPSADEQAAAAVWVRGGRLRYVALTRGGASDGTVEYDDYCYDRAGRLRYMREEYRSPAANWIAIRERGWSAQGQTNGEERHSLWLTNERPRPAPAGVVSPAAPVYARSGDLPFFALLPTS